MDRLIAIYADTQAGWPTVQMGWSCQTHWFGSAGSSSPRF